MLWEKTAAYRAVEWDADGKVIAKDWFAFNAPIIEPGDNLESATNEIAEKLGISREEVLAGYVNGVKLALNGKATKVKSASKSKAGAMDWYDEHGQDEDFIAFVIENPNRKMSELILEFRGSKATFAGNGEKVDAETAKIARSLFNSKCKELYKTDEDE